MIQAHYIYCALYFYYYYMSSTSDHQPLDPGIQCIFGPLVLKLWDPSFIHLYLVDANYVPGTGPCIRWRTKLKKKTTTVQALMELTLKGRSEASGNTCGDQYLGGREPGGKEVHGAEAEPGDRAAGGQALGERRVRLPPEAPAWTGDPGAHTLTVRLPRRRRRLRVPTPEELQHHEASARSARDSSGHEASQKAPGRSETGGKTFGSHLARDASLLPQRVHAPVLPL